MPNSKRYNNPFSGKPSKFDLGLSLFMFSPAMLMKLAGTPMRQVITELWGESVAKTFEAGRKNYRYAPKFIQRLIGLFGSIAGNSELERSLIAKLKNPPTELDEHFFNEWSCFILSQQEAMQADTLDLHLAFRIEIEQACAPALKLLLEKRGAEALDYLRAHPLMSQFLWQEAIQGFDAMKNSRALDAVQVSITFEVELAILAAWDVHYSTNEASWFSELLPSSDPDRNPTAQLFQWLKHEAGAASIRDLLDGPLSELTHNGELDEATAKQWSCGSHHPRQQIINAIERALFKEQKYAPFAIRDFAVRKLNMLGYLAQTIKEEIDKRPEEQKAKMLPWPNLPFGHTSFESWCKDRYPVWLDFHRNRQKAVDKNQLSACGKIQSPQPEYQNTSP